MLVVAGAGSRGRAHASMGCSPHEPTLLDRRLAHSYPLREKEAPGHLLGIDEDQRCAEHLTPHPGG